MPSGHVLSPVWAPDAEYLYYILARPSAGGGDVRVARVDGSVDKLVLAGQYTCVSPSPDGKRLAVASGSLMLVDTSGLVLDTLLPDDNHVALVRFGDSGDRLYYSTSLEGVFELDLRTSDVDTVLLTSLVYNCGFDVWGDSILALPGLVYHIATGQADSLATSLREARFCPGDPSLLLGGTADGAGFVPDLVLLDRGSGSVTRLSANPFSYSSIINPCWSPGGEEIAVAAARVTGGGLPGEVPGATAFDLWILDME